MKNYWNTFRSDWKNNKVAGGLFVFAAVAWAFYCAALLTLHLANVTVTVHPFAAAIPVAVTLAAVAHLAVRPAVRNHLRLGA